MGLPLYAAGLGLGIAFARPHTADEGARPEVGGGPSTLLAQLWVLGGALALISLYRGYEGPLAQGQLVLGAGGARLSAAVWGLGGLGLVFLVPTSNAAALANPALGLRPGSLAPLTLTLWSLLPLVTHVSTALLVLELVGVGLVWAVTSTPAVGRAGAPAGAPLGVANGVILFV